MKRAGPAPGARPEVMSLKGSLAGLGITRTGVVPGHAGVLTADGGLSGRKERLTRERGYVVRVMERVPASGLLRIPSGSYDGGGGAVADVPKETA